MPSKYELSVYSRVKPSYTILATKLSGVLGNKLTSLVFGDDCLGTSWPARVGSTLVRLSTGSATAGILNGRKAARFAQGAAAVGYVLPVNQVEYWAVARYDGALPIPTVTYPSIIGGPGATSPRLMPASGTSELLESGTITRDGVATRALDRSPHIWRAVGAATADGKAIGAYISAANTFVGDIACVLSLSSGATAGEASAVLTALRQFYRI